MTRQGQAELRGVALVVVAVMVVAALLWGVPRWNVYRRELAGKAQLREAEWNRRIAVEEANAKKDAAEALAEAEVARARGIAQANEIIGHSLRDNEAYLRYLWIMGLQDGSSEVIYVPTEAQLPILEAGRAMQRAAP